MVSTVTRLGARLSEILNLAGAKVLFFLQNIQTTCGALPASYTFGTGGSFPGVK